MSDVFASSSTANRTALEDCHLFQAQAYNPLLGGAQRAGVHRLKGPDVLNRFALNGYRGVAVALAYLLSLTRLKSYYAFLIALGTYALLTMR